MGFTTVEISEPALPPTSFPTRLEQRSKTSSQILTLLLLGPSSIVVVMPLLMVATHLAADPHARLILSERPASALLLVIAFAVWAIVFAWPVLRATERLLSRRTVSIADGQVTVEDRSLLGTETWTLPLAAYRGLTHHVRAAISGTRHELILVHENRDRNVVLAIADRFTALDVERSARLLDLPELQPKELYRLRISLRPTTGARPAAETHALWPVHSSATEPA